jgi:carboxyl-terminal processing protease
VVLVSTPFVLLVAVGGLLGASMTPVVSPVASGDTLPWVAPSTPEQRSIPHLRVFEDVVSLVLHAYVEEADIEPVMDGAMRGLVDSLDAESAYLSPAEVSAIDAGDTMAPADVGLAITRQFYLRVLGVRDGSPADRASLRSGDFIRAIDGQPTRDMSAHRGRRLLRGEAGSTVTLLVIRNNAADPHEVTLTREVATGPPVNGELLDGGEAFVRVTRFGPDTAAALQQQIESLEPASARCVMIDLRGVADGAPEDAVAAARLFVSTGPLATKAGRTDEQTTVAPAPTDGALAMPIILLVSNGTARAAEIFAAALTGNGRAELIGEPTAGLASEQKLFRLPGGHGLWMTHQQYLTPAGDPIHGQGLSPDVAVAIPVVEWDETPPENDPLLARAVELARNKYLLIK